MRKIRFDSRQYNKGFSLFTVIVSVAFVGILGMLVLYMAMSNFYMKITDLKGKDSFYTAERAIEEIKVGLQEEVGDAMSEAYIEVLETYNEMEDNKSQDESRQERFRNAFYPKLVQRIKERLEKGLKASYVDLKVEDNETLEIVEPTLSVLNPDVDKIETNSKVVLKDLKAIYVDSRGRAAIIKTDIQLGIPNVKFATPSTLPDLMNMVVVADSGIVCETDPTMNNEIQMKGSIYAGLMKGETAQEVGDDTSIWVKQNTRLSILSGDKLVCGGEISLANKSVFTSNSGVALWAKGLTMTSATADLLGNTYFADDLTVTSGSGSKITIAGNYYGYGSVESAKQSYYEPEYTGKIDADLSSAIVINGRATTIDLSGVQKLMLAGKNYISTSTVKSIENRSNTSDIMTGESITVKGTQLAYLAPVEVLGTDFDKSETMHNPMTYEEYLKSDLAQDMVPVKWDIAVENWNGKTLRDIGVNEAKPVQEVFYADNAESSGGFVYFYLNFMDESNAAKFMQEYYQENLDIKEQMDKYLSFYFQKNPEGEDTGVYVKDSESYLLYVTNGNILSYDGGEENGKIYNATHPKLTKRLIQDQVSYQNMWCALNRKMITDYEKLNTEVSDPEDSTVQAHSEKDLGRTVFDNLVNERKLKEFVKTESDKKYQYPQNEAPRLIMCNNGTEAVNGEAGTGETLVITKDNEDSLRLVVCTGDVEIEKDVNFKGIIMAKGKITLNPGAKLEAAPVDAAKVFQEQLEDAQFQEQNLKAQDFFWDGDQYVLGNTTDNSQNTDSELTAYNLADCVIYRNWKKE